MDVMDAKNWLRISDAAFRLGLPYRVAYDMALSGRLEARRVGAGWRVSADAVERFARARRRQQGGAVP